MDNDNLKKRVKQINFWVISIYLLIVVGFYYIGGEQIRYKGIVSEKLEPQSIVGEIQANTVVRQEFTSIMDEIQQIQIIFATFGRENNDVITIAVGDADTNKILVQQSYETTYLEDNSYLTLNIENGILDVMDKQLFVEITSKEGELGNAVTVWKNEGHNVGELKINDQIVQGNLCIQLAGRNKIVFAKYYFMMALIGFCGLIMFLKDIYSKLNKNVDSKVVYIIKEWIKYRFLLTQLIARDFKTKYKRSVLGVIWSFLNPLLTMMVQYIVFSTLFKSDIEKYPVYLLSGIVIFSFFQEATSVSLMSIVGNASLITKVYVPKYMYTVSGIFSSVINLLLSLIPLFFVILMTKTKITVAYLLLPYGFFCTLIFCIGIGLILAATMVFFRDTQFLWGIITMLWMYFTPIFYPISIIPEKLMFIYKMNPLYHFIRFNRTIILEGVSPEPMAYISCLTFAIVSLMIGIYVFRRTEDKFVLNI